MSQAPEKNQHWFVEIESLRGLAALLVIFYHIPAWNQLIYNIPIFRHGHLMVDFFFVLSGFVIFSSYHGRIRSTNDALKFHLLRIGRLYPVHLLFLFVFLFFECIKYIAVTKFHLGVDATSLPFSSNNLAAFTQHLLLIQAIGPSGLADTYNYPAWSISVEFYTYFIFSGIALFLPRKQVLAFATLFVTSAILLATDQLNGYTNLLRGVVGFTLGACLFQVLSCGIWFKGFIVTAFAAGGILMWASGSSEFIAVDFLAAALLLSVLSWRRLSTLFCLNTGPLKFLGKVSYSLYMCHAAVIWVFNQALKILLDRPIIETAGTASTQLSLAEAVFAYIAVVASCVIVSIITYHLIEQPCRSFSRRKISKAF